MNGMEVIITRCLDLLWKSLDSNFDVALSTFIFVAFSVILVYHTRRTAPAYRATFKRRSSLPLMVHIASGSFEMIRYTFSISTEPVRSDSFDLMACLLQSVTNLMLVKTLVRGNESTRPSYQVAALIRPIIGMMAFFTGDVKLHRASVKLVNAFVWTRAIIFVTLAVRMDKIYRYSAIYACAVFFGGMIAVYESALPAGPVVYTALVAAVHALEQYISRISKRSQDEMGHLQGFVLRWLVWIGLARLETIKEIDRPPELVKVDAVKDLYVSPGIPKQLETGLALKC